MTSPGEFNQDNDQYPIYPSSYDSPNILSVTGITSRNQVSGDYGALSVDMAAPARGLWSTVRQNGYVLTNSSPMGAPHVAAAAALVASVNPSLSATSIKALLMSSGEPLPSLANKTVSGRRLNLANALTAAGPVAPAFALGMEATTLVTSAGDPVEAWVDVDSIAGFGGAVTMSAAANQPFDGALTFATSPVVAPGRARLRVTTTPATAPGLYTFTITGASAGTQHQRRFLLQVRPHGVIEEVGYSPDAPILVPPDQRGISSTIEITRAFELRHVRVEVAMGSMYTGLGGLFISLRSPSGATVRLHSDDSTVVRSVYSLPAELVGTQSAGAWTLTVMAPDRAFGQQVLDNWSITTSNAEAPGRLELSPRFGNPLVMFQNGTRLFTVDVHMLDGYFAPAQISVLTDAPIPGSRFQLSGSSVIEPREVEVYLSLDCSTPPGTHTFYLQAESRGFVTRVPLTFRVLPDGTFAGSAGAGILSMPIPDGSPDGALSEVSFPYFSMILGGLLVEVDLQHPQIDELTVELIAPTGQVTVLHDRQGTGQSDLHRFYEVPSMVGLGAFGTWKLRVVDHASKNRGFLNGWEMVAYDTRRGPLSGFGWYPNGNTVAFTDFSHDAEGECFAPGWITAWQWNFGDGQTSTESSPTHIYAAPGTYSVTLTVTDNDNISNTSRREVMARGDALSEPPAAE